MAPDSPRAFMGSSAAQQLLAAHAEPGCENQLGKLLVSSPGSPNGRESSAKLSSVQFDWVSALKPHLELRGYKGF